MSADANADQQKYNHVLKEKNRVSNFSLGAQTVNKFQTETINSEAYKGQQSSGNGAKEAPNLRSTNFSFGSNSLTYDTTAQMNNKKMEASIKAVDQIAA